MIGVCRFSNIFGVTCYMNSILHILQQLPEFTEYIYTKSFKKNIKWENKKDYTIYQLYKLFKMSLSNNNLSIVPKSFKYNIGTKDKRWNEMNYQDSQEFINFLLSIYSRRN